MRSFTVLRLPLAAFGASALVLACGLGRGGVEAATSATATSGIDPDMLDATERRLVADDFGGRASWQDGGRRAGDWLLGRLGEIGAAPAFAAGIAQPFTVHMETLRNERSYYIVAPDEVLTRHRVCYYPAIPAATQDWTARNLVVVFPGSDADASAHEAVLLSAHYDHQGEHAIGDDHVICYGANDNASGASIVLSVADALARRGAPPRRTIAVALFDAEEEGRRGADALLADLPPALRDKQLLEVNLDQMGSLRNGELWFDDDALSPPLHRIVRDVASRHPIVPRFEELGISSDDRNFHAAGIPAIQLTGGHFRQYHTASDGPDAIVWDGLHTIADVTLDLVVTAADGDGGWSIQRPGDAVTAAVTAWEQADAALHVARGDVCTILGIGSEGVVEQSGLVEATIGIDGASADLAEAFDLFSRPNDWPFAAYDQRDEALAEITAAIDGALAGLSADASTPELQDLHARFVAAAATWHARLADVRARQADLTNAAP